MPFELRDFQDLVRLLREHPDWREELRALLLTQELLTLPVLVRELAEGQERLTETVTQLTVRLDQLAARMDQLAARMDQLTARMDQLTARMDQLTARMDQLAARMDQLAARMDQLTETVTLLAEEQQRLSEGQQRFDVQMGEMRGWFLEERYRTRAPAYFGRFLRQVQPVHIGRLTDALRERLEEGELAEVLLSDLILTGRLPAPGGPQAIWVVLEVSTTVDRRDVERAQRRAALLRQARYPAVAVAGGTVATAGARQAASETGVALLLDGRIDGWQEAVDHMLAEGEAGSP
jgi:cell division protein FtsB